MTRALSLVIALLCTAALLILGISSFHHETARSRPVVPPFELFWCANDEDCAVVERLGCCGCAEGGAQAAVTQWRTDELRRFLKGACRAEQVCVQVDLCDKDVRAACVDRQCSLVHGGA